METIKNNAESPKRWRWRPPKRILDSLAQVLKWRDNKPKKWRWKLSKNPKPEVVEDSTKIIDSEEIIEDGEPVEEELPDWKNFNLKEIANINPNWNEIISLKNVEVDEKWEKYIKIWWRKYYEFNWQWTPKKSFYILKGNMLFLWDKIEWLSNRDWVSFSYISESREDISFEQRKTKYLWWTFYFKEVYKTEMLSRSEVITTIYRSWKKIKITKNFVNKYLNWELNKTNIAVIEAAIRLDPVFAAYMEELDEQKFLEELEHAQGNDKNSDITIKEYFV